MKSAKTAEEVPGPVPKTTSIAPPRVWTIEAIVELVTMATLAQLIVFVRNFAQSVLIDKGSNVATSRVVEGGVPMLGAAIEFMARATPEQKRLLATVTPAFLSACATGLLMASQLDATVSKRRARVAVRRKAAATVALLPMARARRDLFCTHLLSMTGGDAEWTARVNVACGAAADGAELATSLDSMVSEGRALAAHVKSQGIEACVDEGYLAEMTELASKARAASGDLAGTNPDASTQAELDWWDGVNLWFLGALVDNFAAAHKIDKRVPKLPLGALKNQFKRPGPSSRKAAPSAPIVVAAPPAVTPPTNTHG